MRLLKQSTSVDLPIGPFVDNADGFTAETGLTLTQPDIRLKKNGGAWAQKNASQTLSHEENGYYEVTLDSTDTDTLGHLRVAVNESGALPVWEDFLVVPANVYDSWVAGADVFQVDVTQFNGTNGTFSSGRPEVNTTHIAGSSVSTSSAQIGVNVVNFGGSAGTFSSGRPEVNATHWRGTAVAVPAVAGVPSVESISINVTAQGHVRDAVGLAAANLDSQLATFSTFNPETLILEGGSLTWSQAARGWTAALLGKCSGLDASPAIYRDSDDTKDRITATVDEDGNRSVVVLDLSP